MSHPSKAITLVSTETFAEPANTIPDHQASLDVRAMHCPMPILKTKAELAKLQVGDVLKVSYQQQEYVKELEMLSRQTGNDVIHSAAVDDHHAAWIRKG